MDSLKAEALEALAHAIKAAVADALTGLELRLLIATLEHAKECVEQIQEVKRPRRKAKTSNG